MMKLLMISFAVELRKTIFAMLYYLLLCEREYC